MGRTTLVFRLDLCHQFLVDNVQMKGHTGLHSTVKKTLVVIGRHVQPPTSLRNAVMRVRTVSIVIALGRSVRFITGLLESVSHLALGDIVVRTAWELDSQKVVGRWRSVPCDLKAS